VALTSTAPCVFMKWYLITRKDNLQNTAILLGRCLLYRLLRYIHFCVQKGCYTIWANQ
jgi:hypothetical protein